MKHFILISCLILCSCLPQEEAEPENPPLPNSNSSVEPDPSILECPPEDIIPPSMSDSGLCGGTLKLSVEELSFGKQGGVRCITTNVLSYPDGDVSKGCRTEFEIVSDTVNDPPHFINVQRFKKEVCPWLTAMKADEHVIYISVDKNETGKERKMVMSAEYGDCFGWFTITQSAE